MFQWGSILDFPEKILSEFQHSNEALSMALQIIPNTDDAVLLYFAFFVCHFHVTRRWLRISADDRVTLRFFSFKIMLQRLETSAV